MTRLLARLRRSRPLVLSAILVLSGVLGAGCGSSSATRTGESAPSSNAATASASSQPAEPQEAEQSQRTPPDESVEVLRLQQVRKRLEGAAEDWYGTPYKWGGESQDGVDCSGFVQNVYEDAFAYSLPRVTETQLQAGPSVERDQIRPGDLVFFQPEGEYNHVGVYLGDGTFVHASSSNGVTDSEMDNSYWDRYYWTARRPLNPSKVPNNLEEELLAYKQPESDSTAQAPNDAEPSPNNETPSDTKSKNTKIASCETASVECAEVSDPSANDSASDDPRKGW